MGLPFLRKTSSGGAGFCLHENGARYMELAPQGGGYAVSSASAFVSASPILEQGMLREVKKVAPLLEQLKEKREGKFPAGLTLGLPPRNVMMRVVTLPRMELEDARGALQWEFEKYFPFPVNEAVYDVADITAHGGAGDEELSLLVAAVRSRMVEQLIEMFSALGCSVSSVEPSLVGAFRALLGPFPAFASGYIMLLLEEKSTQLMVGNGDSPLLFRTLLVGLGDEAAKDNSTDAILREVRSTLGFIKGQFRGVAVDSILCGGSCGNDPVFLEQLRSEVPELTPVTLPLWSTWSVETPPEPREGWESVFGLALRDVMS